MRGSLMRAAALTALWLAALFATMAGAMAQSPTEAQRAAIKSQCRSDYMAHCSSVAPGGAASLQCLQKNMASLAPGCQAAVQAVTGSSEAKSEPASAPKSEPAADTGKPDAAAAAATTTETKAEPAPATTAAPVAAPPPKSTGMKKPSSAQIAAIRSACRSDYPKVCGGVPTGGAQALQCLDKNKAGVSPACQNAVAAVAGGAAAPAGSAPAQEAAASPAAPAAAPAAPSSAAAAPAAAPPAIVLRPMRPREVLFVMRSACGADVRTLCAGVDPGGGRILQCLISNASSLSPDCRAVLSQFAAR
ncbi:MAG TPA: hypothetical protein VFB02_13180 [Bradyrhizobium sp.]|nr:hypothetical protein [Bradyrhizobium sp.]